jgi:spermidine synthase
MPKTYRSKYNGRLELQKIGGKKILNTDHTNFGYGSLDTLWIEAFGRFPVAPFEQCLVLGIGAGNVIWRIREKQPQGRIFCVDIDPLIIHIASKEFGLSECPDVHTIQADANRYMRTTRRRFDIIIIDLFCDQHLPDFLEQAAFWLFVSRRLQPQGSIVWNTNHTSEQTKAFQKIARHLALNVRVLKSQNGWNTVYRISKPKPTR